MSSHYVVQKAARDDVRRIARSLNASQAGVGSEFATAVDQTIRWLLQSPELGEFADGWAGRASPIRRWPVKRFVSHQLFYRQIGGGIEVVRVRHAAEDWQADLFE